MFFYQQISMRNSHEEPSQSPVTKTCQKKLPWRTAMSRDTMTSCHDIAQWHVDVTVVSWCHSSWSHHEATWYHMTPWRHATQWCPVTLWRPTTSAMRHHVTWHHDVTSWHHDVTSCNTITFCDASHVTSWHQLTSDTDSMCPDHSQHILCSTVFDSMIKL